MSSLDDKLTALVKQNASLDIHATKKIKRSYKDLDDMRKFVPKKKDPNVTSYSHFVHMSDAFGLPIQNWKHGTPFYKAPLKTKKDQNLHSAKVLRSFPCSLTQSEEKIILQHRYELAQREEPIHGAIYEIIPYRNEPIQRSHDAIWKEFL